MGFNAPSKIQETALPILLADPPQNMIAQSQSGTGKTAAFVLAMLSRIDTKENYPQVSLILIRTRISSIINFKCFIAFLRFYVYRQLMN